MFVGKNPKTEKQGTDCFFGGVGQPGTEGVVLLRNTKSSKINYTNHKPRSESVVDLYCALAE